MKKHIVFTVIRVNGGTIVQPYPSVGIDASDLRRKKTFVFTDARKMANFVTNYKSK